MIITQPPRELPFLDFSYNERKAQKEQVDLVWNFSRETKETLAYVLGGLGFLHELIVENAERPFLLTASLALMGFPLVLKGEDRLRNGNGKEEKKSSPQKPTDE